MKSLKTLTMIALAASWGFAAGPALAHDGHGGHFHGGHVHGHHEHFGVVIGAPTFFWPIDPFPNYYSPPVVIESPPVYIERDQPSGYSYYCADPRGYYPQVRVCPGGWQRVQVTPVQ